MFCRRTRQRAIAGKRQTRRQQPTTECEGVRRRSTSCREDLAIRDTLIAIGLTLFVCFGAFFELVLSLGAFARTANVVWPVILIVLGVLMIVGRLFNWSRVLDALPPRDSNQFRTPAP